MLHHEDFDTSQQQQTAEAPWATNKLLRELEEVRLAFWLEEEMRQRPKRHPCHCAVKKQPNEYAHHKFARFLSQERSCLDNVKEWRELILRKQQSHPPPGSQSIPLTKWECRKTACSILSSLKRVTRD